MPTVDSDQKISLQLRAFYSELDVADKPLFERLLQSTFAIKNIRNVQLWVRDGSTRRDFINSNTSLLERKMRDSFMRGLLASKRPESPARMRLFEDNPEKIGKQLRLYLFDDYTRRNVLEIQFQNGVLVFTYDSYGSGVEEIGDEQTDEYEDLFDI